MSDLLVLCYHAVSSTWTAELSVTPEALASQLGTLVQRGWRGATFADAVLRPRPGRSVVVTFDDAFLSVRELAFPILESLGLPGTVFAPTAFLEQRGPLQWAGIDRWLETPFATELNGMSWADLQALIDAGWEIGSHTCTHPRLTGLDDRTLRRELAESKRECERRLGRPCQTLAYPYGAVDQRVAGFAASAGYTAAVVLSSSLRRNGPLRWPRVGIYRDDDEFRFGLKVNSAIRRVRASRLWPAHE